MTPNTVLKRVLNKLFPIFFFNYINLTAQKIYCIKLNNCNVGRYILENFKTCFLKTMILKAFKNFFVRLET